MGLSGRKVKQRIQADPRNLTWADDASKFGANYLAKFGWDSSKGLGASGEGRTSHVKVSQKLDMLGIGAAQTRDPNGIAWKQNKDFESLLKRLNENEPPTDVNMSEDNDKADEKEESKEESKEERKERKRREREKKEKKRKREESGNEDEDEDEKTMKKRKAAVVEQTEEVVKVVEPKRLVVQRHRAHRARNIASKSFASKSAASISEILGIASSSATPSASVTPSGSLTPIGDDIGLEKLTTSTKSVADYFKERLMAKASGKSTPLSSTMTAEAVKDESDDEAPRLGLGSSRRPVDADYDDAPRGGLGSVRTTFAAASSSSSALPVGISKFASMFTASTMTTQEEKEITKPEGDGANVEEENDDDSARKEKKKRRKDKKEGSTEMAGEEREGEDKVSLKSEKKRVKEKKRRKSEVENSE